MSVCAVKKGEIRKNKLMTIQKSRFRQVSSLLIFMLAFFVINCSEESPQVGFSDKQSISSEASSDSYFEDAEDISFTVSLASNTDVINHGRTAALDDARLACATLSLSVGATTTNGTITVDFGTGCAFNGVTRKGKILITYSGERLQLGSSISITFENYSVNDVKIEGVRTVTIYAITTSYITHEITLVNGKITWPDGSTATRNSMHLRKWDWNGTPLLRSDDSISLLADGTAEGTNRNGKSYTMQITKDIVFRAECLATKNYLPVSGEKILNVDGKVITVNYGSGSCDGTILVTINGESREVTVVRE